MIRNPEKMNIFLILFGLASLASLRRSVDAAITSGSLATSELIFDQMLDGGDNRSVVHTLAQNYSYDFYQWWNGPVGQISSKNCFLLTFGSQQQQQQPQQPNVSSSTLSVEVHFSFQANDDPRDRKHLFTTAASAEGETQFCLDEYIFLNRMRSFHLHLSIARSSSSSGGAKVQVKLYRVEVKHHRAVVQEPNGNATLTGGWFFYSPQLEPFSFEAPEEQMEKVFQICDIIGDCHEMQHRKITENGSTLYTVPGVVHDRLIKTTPFVRIQPRNRLANGFDTGYRLNYNQANQRSSERLQRLWPNDSLVTRHSATAFSYIRNISRTDSRLEVHIPLSAFDLRVQQVRVVATILEGHNSSLRVTGWHHRIPLTTGYSFTVPAGLNPDVSQVNLTTGEFLLMGLQELSDPDLMGQVLELHYRVRFDDHHFGPEEASLQVRVHLEVRSVNTGRYKSSPFAGFPEEIIWDVWSGGSGSRNNQSTGGYLNNGQLLWLNWTGEVHRPVLGSNQHNNNSNNHSDDIYITSKYTFHLNEVVEGIRPPGGSFTADNFRLDRIIVGSRGRHFSSAEVVGSHQQPQQQQHGNTTYTEFVDTVHYSELPRLERFFKIGYLLQIGDELDSRTINSTLSVRPHLGGHEQTENCRHVPTFADFGCDEQVYHCLPGLFQYDPVVGACRLIH